MGLFFNLVGKNVFDYLIGLPCYTMHLSYMGLPTQSPPPQIKNEFTPTLKVYSLERWGNMKRSLTK